MNYRLPFGAKSTGEPDVFTLDAHQITNIENTMPYFAIQRVHGVYKCDYYDGRGGVAIRGERYFQQLAVCIDYVRTIQSETRMRTTPICVLN
jgi:hypothetical protein